MSKQSIADTTTQVKLEDFGQDTQLTFNEEKSNENSLSEKDLDYSIQDKEKAKSDHHEKVTKKMITITYIVIILTSLVESFAQDSTSELSSYATSSFKKHSLISTASVVYKITAVLAYPVLGKVADFLGRAEGFAFSVSSYTLCYVLFAACRNVQTYIASEVFYAIGRIGFKVYVLIFIGDTTNLINRALLSQLPAAITGIPSTYAGSYIQDAFLDHSTWRWAYGAFAIILGVSVIPLVICMAYVDRILKKTKGRKEILILSNVPEGYGFWKTLGHVLWYELDAVGFSLLLCGLILFFLPFTITGTSSPSKWSSGRTIGMLCVGFVCCVCFVFWCIFTRKSKYAKLNQINQFLPLRLLKDSTIVIAFGLIFLDFTENSMFQVYFSTTMQVGGYYTAGQAARIYNAKKVTVDIASICVGVLMRFVKRSKIFVITGVPILILGHGLLVWFMNRNGVMESNTILFYVMMIFTGVGRAFYTVPLQVIVQGYAGSGTIAMATSFFLFFEIFGALVGTAIAGGVWNTVAVNKLYEHLPAENQHNVTAIFGSITTATSFKKGTAARTAISLAYRETQQILGWASLGLIGPMLILMFFVKDLALTEQRDVYSSDESSVLEKDDAAQFRDTKWWQIW